MEIPGQTFPISAGMIYRCLTGSIEIELYSYLIVFLLVGFNDERFRRTGLKAIYNSKNAPIFFVSMLKLFI